jgi:signal transduction histidine kinase/CheY-like chemotaxis protein
MIALGLTLLADAFYNVDLLMGTYSGGVWYESFYLVSYVIWGVSALHPTSGGPPIDPSERITARRPLLLIIGADLVLVACLAFQIARGHDVPLPPLVALGSMAFTLTVVRMERMVSALRAEVARSRASEAESRELEEHLREAEKLEAVGQLAGGVAHDFNNLLSVIQNYAYFVHDSLPEDDERREDLRELIAAGERGAELVRQLLTFSRRDRSELGRIELDPTVEEITKLLRRTISESIGIELDLRAPGSVVELDRTHLEQMILNLALNAQDAMPTGGALGISTEVTTLSEDQIPRGLRPGGYVRIRVKDSGWGIPEALRERIFEPFFTTKERGSGTGLGLASVYGSVTRSGGSVSVDSVVDVGTTFEILLPTVPVRLVAVGDEPAPRSGPVEASILVAEDEPEIRRIVKRILESSGYRVVLSESPHHALALLKNGVGGIDLLLTDAVMPGMSGQELADRALEVKPQLRCLFMSGYSEEIQARHGVRQTEFLPKPFTSDGLLEAVGRALRT